MKIVAVGDIHGRTVWEKIVRKESFDRIIFIGDYFDRKEWVTEPTEIENFRKILALKKKHPAKVILLIGNHDYHYFQYTKVRYSGFQFHNKDDFRRELLSAQHQGLLQMCYAHDKYLFSHAGVTKTWCEKSNININNLEVSINMAFEERPEIFEYKEGFFDGGNGDHKVNSPIWVRPKSLKKDCLENYIHVVGHTQQKKVKKKKNMVLIDTLGKAKQYLVIDNGKMKVKKL